MSLFTATLENRCRGSDTLTRGVRVVVEPTYLVEESDPSRRMFIFAYRVTITNESGGALALQSRRWDIIDGDGEREEVRGPGVIGQQPRLAPGESFSYTSHCPLQTSWGTMEGSYLFNTDAGERFEAAIDRFYLVACEA